MFLYVVSFPIRSLSLLIMVVLDSCLVISASLPYLSLVLVLAKSLQTISLCVLICPVLLLLLEARHNVECKRT